MCGGREAVPDLRGTCLVRRSQELPRSVGADPMLVLDAAGVSLPLRRRTAWPTADEPREALSPGLLARGPGPSPAPGSSPPPAPSNLSRPLPLSIRV